MKVPEEQMSIFDLDIWYGKTYPEPSVPTTEKISEQFSKKLPKSLIKMPLFLDLRGNGQQAESSWVMGGLLLGEYTMHSFGECPKEENVSRLSQILEERPHPKYSLSEKACQGILSRAAKRGKPLPEQLKNALIHQATLSRSGGEIERDSYGKKAGKGALIQTELSGTLGVSQDQTLITNVIALEGNGSRPSHMGNGSRPSHMGNGYSEKDVSFTLNSVEQHAVAIENDTMTFRKTGHPQHADEPQGWEETAISDTLNVFDNSETRTPPPVLFEPRSQDGVPRIHGNISPTINTAQGGQRQPCIATSIVRRLTPMECERLQGFPDGWTDIGEWTDSKGKKHKPSDSPRYKALGNSIAIPYWFWLLRRISAEYERPATLGSLFDGIGGFPLCWERCNGKGTALWASEIEDFCIAVTKIRFSEEE